MLKNTDFDPKNLPIEFCRFYQGTPDTVRVFASPGRINIIGEHIDYNGGKVFPAAIDKYLYVAIRKRNDTTITYNDLKFPGNFTFDIQDTFTYRKENDYANYLNGILSILKQRGFTFPCGFDVLIVSNVPPAGGISSSSALECGFAYALSEVFGFNISRKDIALIGQQSEHDFMNVNCGIMDQFIISTAKQNTAEVLDCATLDYEYVPLDLGDYRFVVMNTKKKRQLADSKYNERRSQCETALAQLQKAAITLPPSGTHSITNTKDLPDLCTLTSEQFDVCKTALTDPVIQARAQHCVTENARVLKAVSALKNGDLQTLGQLLKASHDSLKNEYEVTGIELDTLVENAIKQSGCIGARMTGAGFGGCAIAIVHNDAIDSFIDSVQQNYTKTIGHDAGFFVCKPGDGVKEVFSYSVKE
ncbi:MAG: galactokinase [Treponema sp.]|nr:galactokinase [Treponema sp.]